MEKYFNQIKSSSIFYGMTDSELKGLLECFQANIKTYKEGEIILRQGDIVTNLYLILDGEVNLEKDSYWGRRMIISRLGVNDIIALSFVTSKNSEYTMDAIALSECKVLVLGYSKCTSMCQNACSRHSILIKNMFEIISKENINLIQKIDNISQKTIKDKLLTFLSGEAKRNKSNTFKISFNRQDLADYLNIDRSAMSFELSKLQKEGYIRYNKNEFVLLNKIREFV